MQSFAAIEVQRVSKQFGIRGETLRALDRISFSVRRGEFVVLIGPSGCGKSTALRLIADIYKPTEGEIQIGGQSPAEARRARQLGVVFQDPTLFAWQDVSGNVELPLRVAGSRDQASRKYAADLIRLVGLGGFEHASPNQLSGGMKQRVAIARALVLRPSVLLLDEPFGALDEITRQRMNLELLRIWSESGTSALLITHSLTEAVFLADRVLVMSARPGRITANIPIRLPRPRDLEMMRNVDFFENLNRVSDALYGATNESAVAA